MDVLEARIRATVIQSWLIAIFSLVVALGLLLGTVAQLLARTPLGGVAFMGLGGLFMLFVAFAMASQARQNSPARQSPVYQAYLAQPSTVAWVYQKVGKAAGLRVELRDGTGLTLAAGRRDIEALFALTRERAPEAILGWGAAQQRAYRERRRA
ncbi:hypothetical protein L6R53_13925 [Myxococcota bacterium]|nr:hypothetical protein [Myxococcota bacterium]